MRSSFTFQVAAIAVFLMTASPLRSAVYIVPEDCPTIAAAIAGLQDGDTIMLRPGYYFENLIITDRYFCIMSFYEVDQDPGLIELTVVDGLFSSSVFHYNGTSQANLENLNVLKGFTIAHGYGEHGGGIRLVNTRLTCQDMIIRDNQTWGVWSNSGGGLYGAQSILNVIDCDIIGNSSYDYGGGASMRTGMKAYFRNVRFFGNRTTNFYGHGKGAAFHADYGAEVELERCIITKNRSSRWGGGLAVNSTAKVKVINCNVFDNEAALGGGGLYLCYFDACVTVLNSVFFDNEPQEVYFDDNYSCYNDTLRVIHSDIEGGAWSIYVPNTMILDWREGNIYGDPDFTDPSHLDFALQPGSPCIDAGIAFYLLEGDTLINLPDSVYMGLAPDMGAVESDLLAQAGKVFQACPDLDVFPNPCHGQFNVAILEKPVENHLIEILNTNGIRVAEGNDVSFLSPGLYFVRVEWQGGFAYSRLIKQ